MNQQEIIMIMDVFSSSNIDKLELITSDFEVRLEKKVGVESNILNSDIEKKSNEKIQINSENIEIEHQNSNVANFMNEKSEKNEVVKKDNEQENNCEKDYIENINEDNVVRSPIVGTFYAAPAEDKAPFVVEGTAVKKGDVLCLLEAMKMMSEVTAPRNGVVKKCLVINEEVVEFNKPLFIIE